LKSMKKAGNPVSHPIFTQKNACGGI